MGPEPKLMNNKQVLYATAAVIFSVNVRHGMGVHVCELAMTRPQELSTVALLSLVTGSISIVATIWSKTSFALTLLRITDYRWLKITLWTMVAFLNVAMGISAVLTMVQCSPVQKSWNTFADGYCWREAFSAYSVASAIYSGLTDVALALLPWTVILNLQMKLTEKIGVAVAMSAGIMYVAFCPFSFWVTTRKQIVLTYVLAMSPNIVPP